MGAGNGTAVTPVGWGQVAELPRFSVGAAQRSHAALGDFRRAGKRFLQKEFTWESIQKLKPELSLSFSLLRAWEWGFSIWADSEDQPSET